jgi:hypothetical protein
VSLRGGERDTLPIKVSDIPLPKVDERAIGRLMSASSKGEVAGYVQPTALKRLSGLVVDPDGYAWLLPAQDSGHVREGVEVVRVSLATGASQRDTVPAFPMVFASPGVYYARLRDRRTRETTVARYELSRGTPPSADRRSP